MFRFNFLYFHYVQIDSELSSKECYWSQYFWVSYSKLRNHVKFSACHCMFFEWVNAQMTNFHANFPISFSIYRKLPTMSTTEETIPAEPIPLIDVNDDPITLDTLNSSTEETQSTIDALVECEDPLCDPLALDDSSISTELADVSDKTLSDLKTPTDGQIILIDVNILRNAEQNELITGRDIQTEDLSETIEEGVPSDGSDSGIDGVASDGSIIEVRPQIRKIFYF